MKLIFLSYCPKAFVECSAAAAAAKSLQLCLTLCDPIDGSPPGSSVPGILQARVLEWVAIPFSRGSPIPWNQTWVFHTAVRFFTIWATRETQLWLMVSSPYWLLTNFQVILAIEVSFQALFSKFTASNLLFVVTGLQFQISSSLWECLWIWWLVPSLNSPSSLPSWLHSHSPDPPYSCHSPPECPKHQVGSLTSQGTQSLYNLLGFLDLSLSLSTMPDIGYWPLLPECLSLSLPSVKRYFQTLLIKICLASISFFRELWTPLAKIMNISAEMF